MNYLTPRAIIVAVGFILISLHAAHAAPPTDIQMLPPTILGSSPAVTCPPSLGTGHVLTWDGSNPIACDGGLSVDNTNNSVKVPASSAAAGCDAAHGGSLRWNAPNNNFEGCIQVSGVWQWAPLGGLPNCADGSTLVYSGGVPTCSSGTCTVGATYTAYNCTPTGPTTCAWTPSNCVCTQNPAGAIGWTCGFP